MSIFNRHFSWSPKKSLEIYNDRAVISMLPLGFSAGLPFLLVFSTLSVWLVEEGVSRTAVGFFAWVGITYSIKFLWAPLIDSFQIGFLARKLGRRRSWIIIGQIGVVAGLSLMATFGPENLVFFSFFAFLVAFSSATQDVSIDAYRIEAASKESQGAMTASYVFGYRLALLVAGAGALYAAALVSWSFSYFLMAGLMSVGILLVFFMVEPIPPAISQDSTAPKHLFSRLRVAVIGPITNFFLRYRTYAIGILIFVAVFRLSDITMGMMANPFFIDLGYTKTEIASVAKVYGFFMTICGAFICGLFVSKISIFLSLFFGGIIVCLSNLLFYFLAGSEPKLFYLITVISFDNFAGGFASTAFIAYLSGLTDKSYTATQYALFSSLMTLPGKFFSGFSGLLVDSFGYQDFFMISAVVGLPGILMVVWLFLINQQLTKNSG